MIEKIIDNLNEIDIKELRELQEKIDNIIDTHNKKEKEKAWNEVVNAIKNYCSSFGSIEYNIYGEDCYINEDDNFSNVGIIFPEDR